jgi:hypothetical protein
MRTNVNSPKGLPLFAGPLARVSLVLGPPSNAGDLCWPILGSSVSSTNKATRSTATACLRVVVLPEIIGESHLEPETCGAGPVSTCTPIVVQSGPNAIKIIPYTDC